MSGYYATKPTEDRENKIRFLKKRIVKMYGSSLINFLSYQTAIPVIYLSDTPEVRQEKQEQIQQIIQEREKEYALREAELLDELDRLMERIRDRTEDVDPNSQFYTLSNTPAVAKVRFRCEKCGNTVRNSSFPFLV
jgi:ABC-type uncharacterized transport system involved in gliding motility auxiliary subunit